jgi:simple sugar transport system permease protein
MAIAGATAASMTVAGHSLPVVLLASLGPARWPGCGTAFWWRC